MTTPFDRVVELIRDVGYHNHRTAAHSDVVSEGVWDDLYRECPALRRDYDRGVIRKWLNARAPGGRHRRVDLFLGEPDADGNPDIHRIRLGLENKSVITAHRNTTNRYDDLSEFLGAVYAVKPEAVLAATVIVGLAQRVLNVPDRIKPMVAGFETSVLPRLSTGDQALWDEFPHAISDNRSDDPQRTRDKLLSLPTRPMAHTHQQGFDWLLIAPMHVDNVDPPRLTASNSLGIDVGEQYAKMIEHLCRAYTARWHNS